MSGLIDLLQQIFLARRGRPVALILLICLVTLSYLSEAPTSAAWRNTWAGQGLDTAARYLATGRRVLFDGYQRLLPRERQSQPVTIVEIDEASLKEIGQWPWPRNRLADLIDTIAAYEPAAIGLDMYMPEPDQTSPAQVAANLPQGQKALAAALRRLPSHELRLAQSLRNAPTVLGAAGFDFQTTSTSNGLRLRPLLAAGGDPLPHLRTFPWVLASLPQLQAAAHGQAVLSASVEDSGVVRRLPLAMAIGQQAAPSLAMEMLRVASGSDALTINVDQHGVRSLQVAELTVPTQSDGAIWLHFARRPLTDAGRVSAVDVLAGKVAADNLQQKLVLVGLTGAGLSDMRITALGEQVPGIEIQAQILESLLDGRFLTRPWWLKMAELGVFAGLGLLMIWLIPQRRHRFAKALTANARASTWMVTGLNLGMVGIGYVLFHFSGLLLDAATMFIGLSGVLASLVSSAMIEIERENQRLALEQQQLREEAARVSGELAAARRIQLGSLPDATQVLSGEQRVVMATLLEPAREVGGDLYDFFLVDKNRLCFVIGDVSGKGVPASMFMAVTKILAKSFAMRLGLGTAAVVTAANQELVSENPEMLFVTLLIGVLDLESGALELVNAGHDAPWRIGSNGKFQQLVAPADAGGPPVCVIDDYDYTAQHLQLAPGDTLCMVTDGITEAMSHAGEGYGTARLEALLRAGPANSAPAQLLARIRADVATFVADAEASDDLTLMILRWNGPASAAIA